MAAEGATVHDLATRRAARITPGTDHWILRHWSALNPDVIPPGSAGGHPQQALRLSADRQQGRPQAGADPVAGSRHTEPGTATHPHGVVLARGGYRRVQHGRRLASRWRTGIAPSPEGGSGEHA
jgi:hypothetical protein